MANCTRFVILPGLLATALLAAGCGESIGPRPEHPSPGSPPDAAGVQTVRTSSSLTGSGIILDQQNSTMGESGRVLVKGFNPTNPRNGDAVVVTFFWVGAANLIDSVTDHLTNSSFAPVGNKYNLVERVSAGGISMATYVAVNVQNIPIADAAQDNVYAVRADLSQAVTDGGIVVSAFSGVSLDPRVAVGTSHSASGSGTGNGSTATIAHPGAISIGAGSAAYGVTMANGVVGVTGPAGYTNITTISDAVLKADIEFAVQAAAGSVDPQWAWFFTSPRTWLASAVALNPMQQRLAFTVQPSTTLPLMTITPAVKVTVVDELGNPVTTYNGAVTIAIGHNGGLLVPGTLSGTKTVNAVNGVATFSDLSIDQAGNGYTLVVTSAGVAPAESTPFDISAF
jgi:hypothetical protein